MNIQELSYGAVDSVIQQVCLLGEDIARAPEIAFPDKECLEE